MALQSFVQLSKESFVYGLTAAAARLVGLILVPIYTRLLTQSSFGILDLLTNGTAILSSVLILGMDASIAITFYETDDLAKRRTISSTFLLFELGFALAACGLLLVGAPSISVLAFGDSTYTPYVQLGLATVPFAVFVGMFLDVARLVRMPLRYMLISLGNLVLTSSLIILAVVFLRMGVTGVLAGTLVGSVVFCLVGFYTTHAQYGLIFSSEILRRMILLGLPLVPASLSLWVINSSNRWFVLGITSSTEQVAILALAVRLAAPVVLVVTALQIAWVPFSLSIARQESAEEVYTRTLLYFFALTFAILLPLTLWAGPIIELFSTRDYLPASQLIALVGMASICSGAYYIVATGLTLSGKTIHIGWTMLVAAGVSVALNLTLIPLFGTIGAAFAGLIGNLVPVVLLYVVAQRTHRLRYDLPKALTLCGASAVLLLVGSVLRISDSILDLAVRLLLLVVFATVLVAIGVVGRRELRVAIRALSMRMRRGADA